MPYANTDKLNAAYNEYVFNVNFSKLTSADKAWAADIDKRVGAAEGMGASQSTVDALTDEINSAYANYKKTGHLVSGGSSSGNTNNSNSSNSSNSNSGSTTVTATKRKSKSRFVKLRKASYQYTHKGKRVSKRKIKKGAIVKINGKTYRIGKNRYIRKVNVAKS